VPTETSSFPFFEDTIFDEFPELYDDLLIRDTRRPPTFTELLDPDTHLYPVEKERIATLLSLCIPYMDQGSMTLIKNVLTLSLGAHANQFRGTGHPYSNHFLDVSIEAAINEMDPISICSALAHDTDEDTMFRILDMMIHAFGSYSPQAQSFVNTVRGLTKLRSRHLRREESETEHTRTVIRSAIADPRTAALKNFDRMKNLETAQGLKPQKRIRVIRESRVHRRLAYILGMVEDAKYISEQMVYQRSSKHRGLARNIRKLFRSIETAEIPEQLNHHIVSLFESSHIQTRVQFPDMYEVYRAMGTVREPNLTDIWLGVDIAFDDLSSDDQWERQTLEVLSQLAWDDRFSPEEPIDIVRLKENRRKHNSMSLSHPFRDKQSGIPFYVRCYPSDIYGYANASLVNLYYHQDWLSTINEQGESALDLAPIQVKKAYEKYHFLQKRFEEASLKVDASTNHYRMLTIYEYKMNDGYVRVIGVDRKGEHTPWETREGATVMDYARDISPTNWSTITGAHVNGKPESYGYVLKPDDVIELTFDSKDRAHWDPLWIHYFRTDEDGRNTVIRNIEQILIREKRAVGALSPMHNKTIQVGTDFIENEFIKRGKLRMIGLEGALPDIVKLNNSIHSLSDFALQVGLGKMPYEAVSQIVESLLPENDKAGFIDVYFQANRPGITASVTSAIKDIQVNPTRILAETLGKNTPARIMVCLDQYGLKKADEVINAIVHCEDCLSLGLLTHTVRVKLNS